MVGGAVLQFKQGKGKEYNDYKIPTNHSGWKELWFYIGNHEPALPERTPGKVQQCRECNENLSPSQMVQLNELLVLITALKEMGVTRASVMLSFFKRRIQSLQKRVRLGFDYLEILSPEAAISRAQRVLLDVITVPYVLKLFSVSNSSKEGHTAL
ncbi:putative gypsy-type retrotransposon [Panicum miliaceum]|uniref:Gypsy-type retrotransposon n=1 Tax=Panicum miliaceum TaxID=4540 RepID=A0A3L6Q1Y2_PANMI|nr:putative gypsy-type retrotransposon [Panicum miliaceum]